MRGHRFEASEEFSSCITCGASYYTERVDRGHVMSCTGRTDIVHSPYPEENGHSLDCAEMGARDGSCSHYLIDCDCDSCGTFARCSRCFDPIDYCTGGCWSDLADIAEVWDEAHTENRNRDERAQDYTVGPYTVRPLPIV